MTNLVKVAVYIDRSEAICAGRNAWDWQKTELDLEDLDARLREALSRCPETDGALQITHSGPPPGTKNKNLWDISEALLSRDLCDPFELEREDMPPLIEATPATALQMLEHLASLPDRLRARGAALLSSAQAHANARSAQAVGQVQAHVAELDRWLSTAPDQLLIEPEGGWGHSNRFQHVQPPRSPALSTLEDEQIAYDLEEAHRLIDGQRPRVIKCRPSNERTGFDLFEERQPRPCCEHLAAAEEVLAQGIQTREEAVSRHLRAIVAVGQERARVWRDVQRKQAEEKSRIAAVLAQQALEAHQDVINNHVIREWASTYNKLELIRLLEEEATTEQVTSMLRRVLFEPLEQFPAFRKIRKQDLLIANPNLGDNASGLEAKFDDVECGFTDPSHQVVVQAIKRSSYNANIPCQFSFRLHRGDLTRRGQIIGISLEARSLLLSAHFGNLVISRAFAIGTLQPVTL